MSALIWAGVFFTAAFLLLTVRVVILGIKVNAISDGMRLHTAYFHGQALTEQEIEEEGNQWKS